MTNIIPQLLMAGIVAALSHTANCQDLVITSNDSMNCAIINVETSYLRVRTTNSHGNPEEKIIPKNTVQNFWIGFYQKGSALEGGNTDPNRVCIVKTKDGNTLIGKVKNRTSEYLYLDTDEIGTVYLHLLSVKEIQYVDQPDTADRKVPPDYLGGSRYFLIPSGYSLQKGELHYENFLIFFNQLNIGLTDHFSLGAGCIPVLLLGGEGTPVWFTPKVSFPLKKNQINVGAGALLGGTWGGNSNFGGVFSTLTIGSRLKNVSIGIGYGYEAILPEGVTDRPMFSFSSMMQVAPKLFIISENYISATTSLISLGARSTFKDATVDYGVFIPGNWNEWIALPWLGIVLPFTSKK